jgi:3-oxoacyl-[acyl-carrier-protein] synthase II
VERIAITGLGLVSTLGRDPKSFIDALLAGAGGISEITAFDTRACRSHRAGKLRDFDPAEYIDPNKLRRIDEVGCLAVSSGKLALADAGVEANGAAASEVGVVLGTYTAGLHSTVDFLSGLVRRGPADVSPMLFSNTVGNAPASLCALEFGLKGANVTVTNKEASSLAAVAYSVNLLRHRRASTLITGGVDDIEANFFRIHDRFKVMSPADGGEEAARPFDRFRNGFVLGEGAFALFMEPWSRASTRGARIYAELLGVGGTSSPTGINRWPDEPTHLARAMQLALSDAGCTAKDVAVVFASANGAVVLDRAEAEAIGEVFGERGVPVVSIKGALGESGASGAASLTAAILSLGRNRIPPTAGLREVAPDCPVDVRSESRCTSGRVALVNSFASGGANYSVVLRVDSLLES